MPSLESYDCDDGLLESHWKVASVVPQCTVLFLQNFNPHELIRDKSTFMYTIKSPTNTMYMYLSDLKTTCHLLPPIHYFIHHQLHWYRLTDKLSTALLTCFYDCKFVTVTNTCVSFVFLVFFIRFFSLLALMCFCLIEVIMHFTNSQLTAFSHCS